MVGPDASSPDLLRVIKGDATPKERQEFEGWLHAAPENRAVYEGTRAILGLIDEATQNERIAVRSWRSIKARGSSDSAIDSPPGKRLSWRWVPRVAVAAGLTVLGFGLAQLRDRRSSE